MDDPREFVDRSPVCVDAEAASFIECLSLLQEFVPAIEAVGQQGSACLFGLIESFANAVRADAEIDGANAGPIEASLNVRVLDGSATGSQHEALRPVEEFDGEALLDVAKGWFTVLTEDVDDIRPEMRRDHVVEVQKREPCKGGERTTDSGFTRAHRTEKGHLILLHQAA
jgi:hypothetical protein